MLADFKACWGINAVVKGMTRRVPYDLGACAAGEIMRTDKWKGEDYPIRSLYVYAGNPVSNQVNTNEYINDVVGNMDLYVVAD